MSYKNNLHLAEGDVENVAPAKIVTKSSASVLPYVGVACLGAFLFGYHLGYVLLSADFIEGPTNG